METLGLLYQVACLRATHPPCGQRASLQYQSTEGNVGAPAQRSKENKYNFACLCKGTQRGTFSQISESQFWPSAFTLIPAEEHQSSLAR